MHKQRHIAPVVTDEVSSSELGHASFGGNPGDQFQQLINATIMLVDDESTTMDVVQAYLEESGYRKFVLVEDSREAIDRINTEKPDIILLDLMMPKISGFEILEEVRNNAQWRHLPVIVLTSSSDPDTKLRVLDLGATDFLAKPVDPSELALRVRNTLAAKAYQDQLAFYDPITNLPNRRFFENHIQTCVQYSVKNHEAFVILHVTLNRFQYIKEILGFSIADDVLRQLAGRLRDVLQSQLDSGPANQLLKEFSLLARVSSEEFVIQIGINSISEGSALAKKVIATLDAPYKVGRTEMTVLPSIGIAVFPDDGLESSKLIECAASAAGQARKQGVSNYQYYSDEFNAGLVKRLDMEGALRRALGNNELVLYFQPKVDIASNRIQGVEALLRWQRDGQGMVSPAEFIPLAEETDLILPISEWVFTQASIQMADWRTRLPVPLDMSINLSAKHFKGRNLINTLQKVIAGSGLEARTITLELTESMLIDDMDNNIVMLEELRGMGFKISIDDFGTGYSSFSYLKRLPIDELKIDRSFIIDAGTDDGSNAIIKAIIGLGHTLGMEVVAEGVETTAQLDLLRRESCNRYQGFIFSKPLPNDELVRKIKGTFS